MYYFIQDADGVPFVRGNTALILDTDQHPTVWANVTWRAWLYPYPLSLTPASLQEKYNFSATKAREIASHIRTHYGFGEKFLATNLENVVLGDMVTKKWKGLGEMIIKAYEWEVNSVKLRLDQNNDPQLLKDVDGRGEKFVELAAKKNLLLLPGSLFSTRNTHFRLSYATTLAELKKGTIILNNLAERY